MQLLLADDDQTLCELLQEFLELEGFSVTVVHDGLAALEQINNQVAHWDAVILDVMMPGLNGFDVLKGLNPGINVPVLMLTARGEDADTVLGLELGADEYVTKPVSPRVLVARLRALIRRGPAGPSSSILQVGDLNLNEHAREVQVNGRHIDLTGAEFNLLTLLVKNAGKLVSREILASEGLGRALTAYDRRIETHMAQIRRKLGKHVDGGGRIKTVRGAGYQYVVLP
jgi:two-component system response regulator CpxR